MLQILVPFVAVSALVALLYCLYRPHWAFLLVLVMFPLEQLLQVYMPFFIRYSNFINLAVIGIAFVSILTRSLRREGMAVGNSNPVMFLVMALYGLWWLGLLWSPATDINADLDAVFAYQLLFLVLMPLCVRDMVEFRRMLVGLMVVGTFIAILILINPRSTYYAGRLVLDLGMTGGGAKDAGNPLALASMGALIALIAALYRPAYANTLLTVVRVSAFVFGLGLAIGSGSRGQVLAASLCGIAFYPLSRRLANPKQFLLQAFGFLILVGGIYAVFQLFVGAQNQERWDPFLMLKDTTLRLEMAFTLFDAYLASPAHWLFGLGTYAYRAVSPDRNADYVHNIAAEILCEHGLVGAIMFVIVMFLLFKHGRRLWRIYSEDAPMRSAVTLLLAACVYMLLQDLKQGSSAIPNSLAWWLVLAKLAYREQRVLAESAAPEYEAWQEQGEFDPQPAEIEVEGEYHGYDQPPQGYALT